MNAGLSPRVRANDWSTLEAPVPGAWRPTRSVSVVIPTYGADLTLPLTLAALKAQSYPEDLLEVIVVDDGNETPVSLPDLRPMNTHLLRASWSWGRANACREGAAAAQGEVIHWLDADMVPCREHVERHMRWHHVLDHAVVLGHKMFIDPSNLPDAEAVREATENDKLEVLFSDRWADEHAWVEKIWSRTADLTTAGFRAFHVHVGATASVEKQFYEDAGGMDPDLKLGEDIELGYRLAMKGAVFVAEREATSWHLGRSTLMRHEKLVQRYNMPFIAERVPDFRKFRRDRGRTYKVPLVEVVVDTRGHTYEDVVFTVNGALQAVPGDVRCVLLGQWSDLHADRRHPLQDPLLELRLLHEEYASDCRVSFAENLDPSAFPAQYRLRLPVGWRPGHWTLDTLAKDMQKRALGLRCVVFPDGQVARLERTAAVERALRVLEDGEDLDDVIDEVSTIWWSEGVEDGFQHPVLAPPPAPPHPRADGPPTNGQGPVAKSHGSAAPRPLLRAAASRLGLGKLRRATARNRPPHG